LWLLALTVFISTPRKSSLFNEWYVRDTSKKIRAVKNAKAKAGERMSPLPPYGYRKDPGNPKRLVVDEESAAAVKRIFQLCIDGYGPAHIAAKMNDARLLIPSAYKYEHGIASKPRPNTDPNLWHPKTIHRILDAPEYLGHTVNFKTFTKSYKDTKTHRNPPEKQLVFENTHPAIIDQDTWDTVRKIRQHKRRSTKYGFPGLFPGVAFCVDCGSRLYYHTAKVKEKLVGSYSCSGYSKAYRTCTAHYITEKALEEAVLSQLRMLARFAIEDEHSFAQNIMEQSRQEAERDLAGKKKKLTKKNIRIGEIDALFERLYEDRVAGHLTDERFSRMSARYEAEQAGLREQTVTLEREIAAHVNEAHNVDKFIALAREVVEFPQLTTEIVNKFINRIDIHNPDNPHSKKNRRQRIDITYSFIGPVNIYDVMTPA
jgi:hypothetical protein